MTSTELAEKVFSFTEGKRLFSAPCHVLLGLSGGADSMALLHTLLHWPTPGIRVSVIHVNHGLRGEASEQDEEFVRCYCDKHAISLVVRRVDVAAAADHEKIGLEEMGRRLRYQLFEEWRQEIGAEYILTAHTVSDQVETVLMHLIRGCGVDGLVGIPASRGVIRRPLLCCDRAEVEAYCAANGVPYVTDESNADIQFTRNRIRGQLLPLLRQLNPSVDRAILRLAEHAGEDSAYLRHTATTALERAGLPNGGYDVSAFTERALPVRRRMIAQVFAREEIHSIEETHILALEERLFCGDGATCLPNGVTACVTGNRLLFYKTQQFRDVPASLPLENLPFSADYAGYCHVLRVIDRPPEEMTDNVHKLFFKNTIDYDRIQGGLYLRCRQEGDTLHPAGRGIGKSLKKLMNEWRIPARERDTYPLLCDELGIVLVPGFTCDERVRVTDDTKHFLVWQMNPEQG